MTERQPTVRDARPDEHAAVMNVLDGAALEVDAAAVGERIPGGVLVAVEGVRVLGTCVVENRRSREGNWTGGDEHEKPSAHVEAIAVRRSRRGQGIGSSLVEAAATRWGTLSAEFDGRNRPFYESLGFDVEPLGEGRFRGTRPADGNLGARSDVDRR